MAILAPISNRDLRSLSEAFRLHYVSPLEATLMESITRQVMVSSRTNWSSAPTGIFTLKAAHCGR